LPDKPPFVILSHYLQNDLGKVTTLVIWAIEDHVRKYREGELIKEAIAFERAQQLSSTRDGPFAVTRLASLHQGACK